MAAVPAVTGDFTGLALSTILKLAAGDYVEIYVYQNSGGGVIIRGTASTNQPTRMQVSRLYNDSTPTARVTLEMIGG